ncbi:hypothetical protein RBB79_13640 [Tunturiibacter empetritectus]|uniref:DUF6843 domain-containing protein n=1 Tax=Tunturiibacter lichenicola TaxID=2051959 RepID=A0A852VCN2_9BACT|nr:hypothetical protein [Edaphobacter lichenicola]NYF90648.1 hypothetical protein [Edaphobacter lichenicola]
MAAEQVRNRWFWAITAANVVVCVLLIVFIYFILIALGAFAAGVTTWPLFVLFATGSVLTAISLPLTRSVPTKRKRRLGYALNGCTLVIYCALLCTGVSIWLHTTRRLFLVPAGFQGDLYVVHALDHGQKVHKNYLRTTYLFSNDGVLETQDPAPTAFSDEYAYVYPDGHLKKIGDAGPSTLPDTPENRANTTEVVTYFARSLTPIGPNDCAMEEISIGTRSFLLSRRFDGPAPDKTHPGICH